MGARNSFCESCREHNCLKHTTLTQRLQGLLEHFEEPEETMRTYIEPDKNKSKTDPNGILPVKHSEHGEKNVGNFDRHDSRIRISESALTSNETLTPRIGAVTTSAMVQVQSPNSTQMNKLSVEDSIAKLVGGKYKPHEKHHFVKINASSFVSCSSPGGVYSEIAFILWVNNRYYSKFPSDRYRVVLSLMYDTEDDLWSISAKLLKRSGYYGKDEEEGQISNRLCITSELRSELKRMLLYLGISPREAYRMFRKNVQEEFITTFSDIGFTTVECSSHASFTKELEKPSTNTGVTSTWDYHRNSYQGNHMHSAHHNHMRTGKDEDKYVHAMMGYPDSGEGCYG